MVGTKDDLLRRFGYRYDFNRMAYINRRCKRALTIEFVEASMNDELRRIIGTPPLTEWYFYSIKPFSDSVKQQFIALMEAA